MGNLGKVRVMEVTVFKVIGLIVVFIENEND